ncbi:MAG: hypothetical protein K2Q20_08020 [Phycisphaerales bacterium]|nr:hypothetical protein [Phycisphaerales bacterium]
MPGHELQDATSLALARAITGRLRADASLLRVGLDNIERWSARTADAPGLLRRYPEWRAIIGRGLDEVLRNLEREDDEGQRLRQSSPFTGILTPHEVWEIKRACREACAR